MLEELSSGCLGKPFPKQLTTLWLWQRGRWECQGLVPFVTQIPFRCFSCCLCSCICKLNRKDLATREANSTESSRISWSRVETSPEETELEVRWPLSPAEWHSHQDTRFVSARKNLRMTVKIKCCPEHLMFLGFYQQFPLCFPYFIIIQKICSHLQSRSRLINWFGATPHWQSLDQILAASSSQLS